MFSFFSKDAPPPPVDDNPLIEGLEILSPSTPPQSEESFFPWERYNESFSEWLGTEIALQIDDAESRLFNSIEQIKEKTALSIMRCSGHR